MIPLSVVFMVIGTIILGAVGAMWWISYATQTPIARLIETAVPLPTTSQSQTPTPTTHASTLLPETQMSKQNTQTHYVSALEAAMHLPLANPQRINIPQIELDAPVAAIGLQNIEIAGNTLLSMDGSMPNSRQVGTIRAPAWDEGGNTVLNGHHNIHGEVFRDLIDLDSRRPNLY